MPLRLQAVWCSGYQAILRRLIGCGESFPNGDKFLTGQHLLQVQQRADLTALLLSLSCRQRLKALPS